MDGVNVTVVGASRRRSGVGNKAGRSQHPKRRLRRWLPFLLVVVLPSLITAGYQYGVAADQYLSEARFVVRGQGQEAPGILSNILQTAGVGHAQEDTYAVQNYILSRDALHELVRQGGIEDIFARPEVDALSRFPNMITGDTFEHLYKYYLKHVDVQIDSITGISELMVRTFRPGDSYHVASALLAAGERLVNRMNERERGNALGDARNEVKLAETRVQEVAGRIADFRNKEALLDPGKQSVAMLQGVVNLQAKLSSVKLEMAQQQTTSPNSPLLVSMRQRAAALEAEIVDAESKITGTDDSLVPKIREFDMLTLERDFADKQLASATLSLEAARISADRQQIYLEAIVQPNTPDYAGYPRRLATLAVVFASLLSLYVMGALLLAGAREHRLV